MNDTNIGKLSFADLMESSQAMPAENSVVVGRVCEVRGGFVVLDVGLKALGKVPLREFYDVDPKVGDRVEVYIESYESSDGSETLLSRERAVREASWAGLQSYYESSTEIEGQITKKTKSGFNVNIRGMNAFLPVSKFDTELYEKYHKLIGQDCKFKIVRLDRKKGSIVVNVSSNLSHIQPIVDIAFAEGDTIEGTVRGIMSYGMFINVGKVDGLLRNTDISWDGSKRSSDFTEGQTVTVKVLKINKKDGKLLFGMKQFEKDPWDDVYNNINIGDKLTNRSVMRIVDYGLFVDVKDGIEGLVYIADISWKRVDKVSDLFSVGQKIDIIVLGIDKSRRRISLGIKQILGNPVEDFLSNNPIGSIVTGKVANTLSHGLMIDLGNDIGGYVSMYNLSWIENPRSVLSRYKTGDTISAIIMDCDKNKWEITLGIKQLIKDPYHDASSYIRPGSVLSCKVCEIQEAGITVELDSGLRGFIKRSHMAADKSRRLVNRFMVGDTIKARVLIFDHQTRNLLLSIKDHELEHARDMISKYSDNASSSVSLGDMLSKILKK